MKQALNKVKKGLRGLLFVPVLALGITAGAGLLSAPSASAVEQCSDSTYTINNGVNCAQSTSQKGGLFTDNGIFRQVTNILLFIVGAIAVIMLIIGGIRYVVSGGDSSAVTAAKNTILYAIIGIIIVLLAFAIVQFVVGSFSANP